MVLVYIVFSQVFPSLRGLWYLETIVLGRVYVDYVVGYVWTIVFGCWYIYSVGWVLFMCVRWGVVIIACRVGRLCVLLLLV